jgi:hypothetical protein
MNKKTTKVTKKKVTVKSKQKSKSKLEYCIVRTNSAGVFAGMFNRKNKTELGTVFNARRIWYWDGAASLSQLALSGTSNPSNCKFPDAVAEIDLRGIIEVIPCTKKAETSIRSVPIWSK